MDFTMRVNINYDVRRSDCIHFYMTRIICVFIMNNDDCLEHSTLCCTAIGSDWLSGGVIK